MFQYGAEELIILVSTPLYIGFILFEVLLGHWHDRNWYNKKDTLNNVYLMLLNSSIDLLFRGVYVIILAYCWQHRLWDMEQNWLYWVLLVIAIDFMFYWLHRLEHGVRIFWAVHVTHHSSNHFNFTVGFRSSVFQPLYRFIFFMPLAFSGFSATDIVLMFSASHLWGILVHTEMVGKLGWLETIFVTPSHHRVHHASNPLYLDKNMGMFLIVWDKLFGTFQPERTEKEYQPIKYGLTTQKDLHAPIDLVLHEWKDILTDLKRDIPWEHKVQYILGPPGWSHDGSRLTSDQLRALENMAETNDLFSKDDDGMQVLAPVPVSANK
ncbi:MAG TPA: sterol desaturase family protein [Phnomibacter sp.]|nr:sterol desaturase family protein [Phnomibacter sp.]